MSRFLKKINKIDYLPVKVVKNKSHKKQNDRYQGGGEKITTNDIDIK